MDGGGLRPHGPRRPQGPRRPRGLRRLLRPGGVATPMAAATARPASSASACGPVSIPRVPWASPTPSSAARSAGPRAMPLPGTPHRQNSSPGGRCVEPLANRLPMHAPRTLLMFPTSLGSESAAAYRRQCGTARAIRRPRGRSAPHPPLTAPLPSVPKPPPPPIPGDSRCLCNGVVGRLKRVGSGCSGPEGQTATDARCTFRRAPAAAIRPHDCSQLAARPHRESSIQHELGVGHGAPAGTRWERWETGRRAQGWLAFLLHEDRMPPNMHGHRRS